MERFHRSFLGSSFSADSILEAVFRHALFQFAFDESSFGGVEAPLPADPSRWIAEPPTLEDYLNTWGGFFNFMMRAFRCFEPSQRLDVLDCEMQVGHRGIPCDWVLHTSDMGLGAASKRADICIRRG
jgi:hypothetical protein